MLWDELMTVNDLRRQWEEAVDTHSTEVSAYLLADIDMYHQIKPSVSMATPTAKSWTRLK
jgi:hypothetical protein